VQLISFLNFTIKNYKHVSVFNVRGNVHRQMCILCNQRDATYTVFLLLSALYMFRAVFPPIIRSL